jgi:hypothetical protein
MDGGALDAGIRHFVEMIEQPESCSPLSQIHKRPVGHRIAVRWPVARAISLAPTDPCPATIAKHRGSMRFKSIAAAAASSHSRVELDRLADRLNQ